MADKNSSMLKTARLHAGLTQKQAAEKAGITQSMLSMIENSTRKVSFDTALTLFKIYDEENPLTILSNHCDADGENAALRCVSLLQSLASLGGSQLLDYVDKFICLCAYCALREIYLANPHNSERPFSINSEEFERVLGLLSEEPEHIGDFAVSSAQVRRARIEPSESQSKDFAEIIALCESLINGSK